MTTIQIFDSALCCSTGVCGVDVPLLRNEPVGIKNLLALSHVQEELA